MISQGSLGQRISLQTSAMRHFSEQSHAVARELEGTHVPLSEQLSLDRHTAAKACISEKGPTADKPLSVSEKR